ncbi:MAG: hypothetical protein U0527_13510 [Candidatus Eisenbacteria bacterium]
MLDGKAEPGKLKIFGCQVRMQLSNATTIEVAGEATSEKFDFEDAGDPGHSSTGRRSGTTSRSTPRSTWSCSPSAPSPSTPAGVVAFTSSQIDVIEAALQTKNRGASTLGTIDDWLAQAEKDRSDVEWHGLGGASLQLGAARPFRSSAKERYRDITGDQGLQGWAAYAGFNLRLDQQRGAGGRTAGLARFGHDRGGGERRDRARPARSPRRGAGG